MASKKDLEEARVEAQVILKIDDADIAQIFFRETMRRNLSRLVRHLDQLVENGGEDRHLGARALKKLGFDTEA